MIDYLWDLDLPHGYYPGVHVPKFEIFAGKDRSGKYNIINRWYWIFSKEQKTFIYYTEYA